MDDTETDSRARDRDDPVQVAAGGSRDLYDVATWERRSALDTVASGLYRVVALLARIVVIGVGIAILLAQGALAWAAAAEQPLVAAFVALSVVPALALVAYIWYADPTAREKVGYLVGTFLLGILFAGFAAVANSLLQPVVTWIPVVGMALFFYLVVAPVEETVKLLAVRLGAYNSARFNAVIDGAVYGAMAGLGFATIENALYISRQYFAAAEAGSGVLARTFQTAVARTLAGPGHVIYSAFAGYYLGLAKFNPREAGPIVVKGLLIAAFIHGTYNTLVSYVPAISGVSTLAFVGFVLAYDGIFGYLLYRKLKRYRSVYESVDAGDR